MATPNKTRIQVATDPAFSNVVYDVNGAYTTELLIAESELPVGVNLYARGMHGHPDSGDSTWSTTVQFQIQLAWSDWDGSANGIEYSLNSTYSDHISAVALSDTTVLVSYCNDSHSNYLYAVVLTVSGSSITAGTPVQCDNSTYINHISAVALSDTTVLVSYCNNSQSGYLYAVVLTVSGSSITAGTPVLCHSANSNYISAVALSDTTVLVSYRNVSHSDYLYAVVLTVSGSGITAGTPVQCNSSTTGGWGEYDISATKVGHNVLVAYNKGSNTTLYGKVLVG